jgi:hypothetical protein
MEKADGNRPELPRLAQGYPLSLTNAPDTVEDLPPLSQTVRHAHVDLQQI